MAQFTIDEVLHALTGLPSKIGDAGVEIIRDEFSEHNKTGKTSMSFTYKALIGRVVIYSQKDSAYYVEYGRGVVLPKKAKALHWVDPLNGRDVFAMRAAPYAGDDYVQRTIDRLEGLFASMDLNVVIRNLSGRST